MANEERLIDANALKGKLEAHRNLFIDAWGSFSQMPTIDKVSVDTIDTCVADVVNAPTVDAVEVVHGRWKYYHKQNKAVCTNCSFERDLDVNFGRAISCPNCGAKMDGDGNENV